MVTCGGSTRTDVRFGTIVVCSPSLGQRFVEPSRLGPNRTRYAQVRSGVWWWGGQILRPNGGSGSPRELRGPSHGSARQNPPHPPTPTEGLRDPAVHKAAILTLCGARGSADTEPCACLRRAPVLPGPTQTSPSQLPHDPGSGPLDGTWTEPSGGARKWLFSAPSPGPPILDHVTLFCRLAASWACRVRVCRPGPCELGPTPPPQPYRPRPLTF